MSSMEKVMQDLINRNWVHAAKVTKYGQSSKLLQLNVEDPVISFPKEVLDGKEVESGLYGEYRNRRILEVLRKFNIDDLWEIGAGNGDVTKAIHKSGIHVVAVEPLISGAEAISELGILTFCSSLESLKLPAHTLKNVAAFDVLEHIENEKEFLDELQSLIQVDGKLIITVPAHNWLFSSFDKEIGHFRRYNKKSIEKVMNESGFQVAYCRYFMKSLVFPAFILRKIWRSDNFWKRMPRRDFKQKLSHDFEISNNKFLINAIRLLDRLLPNLFGLSMLVVLQKQLV